MKSFHWDEHFVTGLATVDQQHQSLVEIINQFSEMLDRENATFEEIEGLLKQLADYAQYHFKEEESLMTEVGIDQRHRDNHFKVHQDFLLKVSAMQHEMTQDESDSTILLLDFLIHWLAYHILCIDQNMARQIKAIQSGVSAIEAYDIEEKKSDNSTEPLLAALNNLFQQVDARNKELTELNKLLEEKVAARTQSLVEANAQLEELALTDVLTNIPNRRHAMKSLAALWKESINDDTPLTCMMIDADHFKEINDNYGHDAGDRVLCELSKTLQYALRTDDIINRLGGDEFLVICPNTDLDGGRHVAGLIHKAVSELHVPTGDAAWQGSISVGVACRTPIMQSYEDLIKQADRGVYAAKRDGKNCIRG